jgi:hypothetical protein
VLIASPDKPLARSSKDTIIRRVSENSYKDEIDRVYTMNILREGATVKLEAEKVYMIGPMMTFVRDILAQSFMQAAELEVDDDWFAFGLDSIQMVQFGTLLRQNIEKQTAIKSSWVSPRNIYQLCTIRRMASALCAFLNHGEVPSETTRTDLKGSAVNKAVEKYTQLLQGQVAQQPAIPRPNHGITVAIIGSTGYVGERTLASLLKDPSVSRIFCLNRSEDAKSRQEEGLASLDAGFSATIIQAHLYACRIWQTKSSHRS